MSACFTEDGAGSLTDQTSLAVGPEPSGEYSAHCSKELLVATQNFQADVPYEIHLKMDHRHFSSCDRGLLSWHFLNSSLFIPPTLGMSPFTRFLLAIS